MEYKIGDTHKIEVKNFGTEWNGIYEVKVLSMAEIIDLEAQLANELRKCAPGTLPDLGLSKARAILKSVIKDGKPLDYKPEDLLNHMPAKLYTTLYQIYQRLNEPDVTDTNFLSEK